MRACVRACVRVCVCVFDICFHWALLFANLLRRRLNQSISGLLQKLLQQNYRSYNYENGTKWNEIDLRNKHFNLSFLGPELQCLLKVKHDLS